MLRIILNISREDFCLKHEINFNTLTSIEIDRLKLSAKQLHKLIEAFAKEGLYVEPLWIIEAKGPAPTRLLSQVAQKQGKFLEDWAHFFTDNRNAVILQIKGDFMEPFYASGDLVGGVWNSAPHLLMGKRCIVEWENQLHVGGLFGDKDMFSLAPANIQATYAHIMFQSPPAKVAEVLWHIRKNSHQIPELSSLEVL